MNKSRILLNVVVVSALVWAAGCANDRFGRSKYLPDGEVISGRAEEATVYDLDTAVQSLMSRMRAHPTFLKNYEAIAAKKKGRPLLQVLPIDCNCAASCPAKSRLAMVRDKICQSVFESDQFVLRDVVLSEALQNAEPPDCVLRGSLTRIQEKGGCYVYRLQLILADPQTSTVLWQGTDTVLKIDWMFR